MPPFVRTAASVTLSASRFHLTLRVLLVFARSWLYGCCYFYRSFPCCHGCTLAALLSAYLSRCPCLAGIIRYASVFYEYLHIIPLLRGVLYLIVPRIVVYGIP